jgi:hypothetical protein
MSEAIEEDLNKWPATLTKQEISCYDESENQGTQALPGGRAKTNGHWRFTILELNTAIWRAKHAEQHG